MSRDHRGDAFDLFSDRSERGRFGDNESADKPRVSGASNLHDFVVAKHYETHPGSSDRGAVLVSSDGEEASAFWLPKSHTEIVATNKSVPGHKKNGQSVQLQTINVTVPRWLAVEKGLL